MMLGRRGSILESRTGNREEALCHVFLDGTTRPALFDRSIFQHGNMSKLSRQNFCFDFLSQKKKVIQSYDASYDIKAVQRARSSCFSSLPGPLGVGAPFPVAAIEPACFRYCISLVKKEQTQRTGFHTASGVNELCHKLSYREQY